MRNSIKLFTTLAVLAIAMNCAAQTRERKLAPIMTTWGENIDPENVWTEYPRPQMVRQEWLSLNGTWNFLKRTSVNHEYESNKKNFFQKILLPYPVKSA